MAIAASPTTSALPAVNLPSLIPALQELTTQLEALVPLLRAVAESQAGTGSRLIGGGPTGCGCSAAQATAGVGALGAPSAPAKAADTPPVAAPAAAAAPAPAKGESKGEQIVAKAKAALGKPYKFGAAGPGSYDCSGLTLAIMKEFGVSLPHSATAQMKGAGGGKLIVKADLKPGDLVFFSGGGHTGIYIGNDEFIHAPKPGDVVKVSKLSTGYYASRFENGRRYD